MAKAGAVKHDSIPSTTCVRTADSAIRFLIACSLAVFVAASATASGPSPVLPATGASMRPVDASGLKLQLGPALLHFDSGTVFVEVGPEPGVVRAVFVGKATSSMTIKDPVERRQLMLFTGYPMLLETFSTAVLTLGPGPLATSLADRAAVETTDEIRRRAVAAWQAWQRSPERRILGIDKLLLRGRYGDRLAHDTVYAVIDGINLGRFFVIFEPQYREALTVGNVETWDQEGTRREEVRRQEKTGFNTYEIKSEKLVKGTQRIWVSSKADGTVSSEPDIPSLEVPRMDLDVALRGSHLKMSVAVDITVRANRDGLRIVELGFSTPVKHFHITGPAGQPLETVQSQLKRLTVLPAPISRGDTATLHLSYELKIVERPERKAFAMVNPGAWMPWVAGVRPDAEKLTIHWPKKLDLFAPGTVVGGDAVSGKMRTRTLELKPGISSIPFAIGNFETRKLLLHGQEIVVAADRTARRRTEHAADDLMESVRKIVSLLRGSLGPLPYGRLTVVTADQVTSLSLPGFVLLSSQSLEDLSHLQDRLGIYSTPEGNLAFSIAQQWFGNAIRWKTTRDGWWSHGAADLAALHVMWELANGEGRTAPISIIRRRILPERILLTDGLDARTMASPVLNRRILSDKTTLREYITVMDIRSSQILALIDATAPNHDLLEALARIVRRDLGARLSTRDFLAQLGAELGVDARSIAAPFMKGDPPPVVVYSFSPGRDSTGGWRALGSADLSAIMPQATVDLLVGRQHPFISPRHRWRVDGIRPPVGIPYGILGKTLAEGGASSQTSPEAPAPPHATRRVQNTADFGVLRIEKPAFDFQIAAPFPPFALYLNPFMQVPLVAVSQDFNPMFVELFEGLRQAATGNLAIAQQMFQRITDTCDTLQPVNSFTKRLEDECTVASMAAHIHLGEIALTWADLDSAAAHLASARTALARVKNRHRNAELPSPPSIEVLAARIDLASGDPDTGRARLSAITSQKHPLTADGYAVLAVAAALSGHSEEAARARASARQFGLLQSGTAAPTARP